jgi:hypothetical protein
MASLGGIGGFLVEHPIIGLIVFLAVSAGVLFVLSGGRLGPALLGILRVAVTIFTTPFVFLRDALVIITNAGDEERDYQRTRVFMLFRYSRIQYLVLLVAALLVLAGGITTSLLSLYPQAEMAQSRQLTEYIDQLREQVSAAEDTVETAGSPEGRQALETLRNEALAALQQQQQSNAAFAQTATHSSNAVSQILSTRNAQALSYLAANIDSYMADCPRGYSWQGFTPADCANFRTFLGELVNRRTTEFNLAAAYENAERAWREADASAQQATAQLEGLQTSLAAAREQRGSISLFNPSVIGGKLKGAIGILITTALSVVVLIWLGAILIDVLNLLILLMRSAEIENAAKLARARAETGV